MSTTSSENARETGRVPETLHLNPLAFGEAAAVVSAAVMLLLGIFGAIGVYEGGVAMMEQWQMFFAPTVIGTLAGMVEAAVVAFVFVYAFAWLYDAFAR